MNQRIVIENNYEYGDDIIRLGSVNGINTSALVGDMLEIDQLKFRVSWVDKSDITEVYMTKSGAIYRDSNQKVYRLKTKTMPNLLLLPYAAVVMYYQDNVLRAKMYVDHVDRVSKTDFTVTCVSGIGILDRQTHLGGIYTGQTVQQVISEIIDGVLPFSVASDLASAHVYGWLPIESKREALHQLLFAHGANILKDNNGDLYFDYLQQTSVKQIPNGRIFIGGKSIYTPPSTRVEVIEHTYFQSQYDETITLFDNTQAGATPAGNTFIAFAEAPCYDLQASSGLTINSYGVNWANITGVGVLTGKKYAHQTGIATRSKNPSQTAEKNVTSKNCTLISMLTSPNVTRRLLSYYASAQKFSIDMVRENENVGDQVQFTSPFGDTITGFLASIDWSVTSIERAKAEIVMNYEPTAPGGGGGYSHVKVITANGTWTVPSDVTEITAVVIGGGSGGQGGFDGAAGTAGANVTSVAGQTKNSAGGVGGAGGAAGAGGNPGKVFQARFEVAANTTLTASIGAGGTGGARGGYSGGNGGNTTLTGGGIDISSANGYQPTNGFYDVVGQILYAVSGGAGTSGGAGGAGGNVNNQTGVNGGNVGSKTGGNAGSVVSGSGGSRTAYTKPANNSYVQTIEAGGYSDFYDIPYMTAYKAFVTETIPNDVTVNDINGNFSIPSSYTQQSFRPTDASQTAIFASGRNFIIKFWHWFSLFGKYRLVVRTYTSVQGTASPAWTALQFAGGGGGASVSANGGNASNNNGGAGANASAPSAPTVPGSGGNGGNGGGGGAGGGGASITAHPNIEGTKTINGGSAGSGGQGSAGGAGAQGCVIIYY